MVTSTHYVVPKFWLRNALLVMIVLLVGATVVLSQQLVQPDRRINQVAHFGGDALYCVDRNFNPTHQYSDFGQGGFRLLNKTGQELWFVPSDVIAAAVAEAKATGQSVLVATGMGTYGPTRIDAYTTGDGDDYFVFIGYDEYGKPNSIEWKFCNPVGPVPQPVVPGGTEEPECILEGMYDELVPCDEVIPFCEENAQWYETEGYCLCFFGQGTDCPQFDW